mgnify:CR=1 FL=1
MLSTCTLPISIVVMPMAILDIASKGNAVLIVMSIFIRTRKSFLCRNAVRCLSPQVEVNLTSIKTKEPERAHTPYMCVRTTPVSMDSLATRIFRTEPPGMSLPLVLSVVTLLLCLVIIMIKVLMMSMLT